MSIEKMEAQSKIAELIQEVANKIREAEWLANEHELSFCFSTNGVELNYNGKYGQYDTPDQWYNSSLNC